MDWYIETEKDKVGVFTINTKFSPSTGDLIELPNGKKYKVTGVGWRIGDQVSKGVFNTIGLLIVEPLK